MPASYVYPSEDGYSIQGLDPPDFWRFPADVKTMFWGWVVEIGLQQKDRDLAKGLDKNGKPFRPIREYTRKHRRSAMTPSGRGDPNAPPLIPGWQKSRTRSLLTGKAFPDHAEFWWKYDAHTGDSWARILEAQRANGRDAFGLGPQALARVKAQTWERWEKWKKGKYEEPAPRKPLPSPQPVRVGSYRTKYLDVMGSEKEIEAGQHAGFMTIEEWEKYFRQTAAANLPGRPLRPKVMSSISGPKYNRLLAHVWEDIKGGGGPSPRAIPVRAPRPGPILSAWFRLVGKR